MKRYFLWVAIVIFAIAYFFLGFRYGLTLLNYMGISFSDASIIVDVLRSLIETIAIIVAGVWTYERFIKSREDYPYPKIQHRIEHYELGNGIVYLSLFVTLTNEGKTKLDLQDGKIYIRQVLPMREKIKQLFEKSVKEQKSQEIRKGEIPELFIDSGHRIT